MMVAPASSGLLLMRSASAKPSISGIVHVEQDERETARAGGARRLEQRQSAARPLVAPTSAACPSACSISSRMRRLVALSSTTRTGRPRKIGRAAAGHGRAAALLEADSAP